MSKTTLGLSRDLKMPELIAEGTNAQQAAFWVGVGVALYAVNERSDDVATLEIIHQLLNQVPNHD